MAALVAVSEYLCSCVVKMCVTIDVNVYVHQGASRAAPGKSSLHTSGEGAYVIALQSW